MPTCGSQAEPSPMQSHTQVRRVPLTSRAKNHPIYSSRPPGVLRSLRTEGPPTGTHVAHATFTKYYFSATASSLIVPSLFRHLDCRERFPYPEEFAVRCLSSALVMVNQGGVHHSGSVGCGSLDWPQSLDPSSLHRAGNAIQLPEAAPYLAFGWQSKGLGNADTA